MDGSHDNAQLVRTATISQKYKIMTLTFFPNVPRQNVSISITAEINGVNQDFQFNVTAGTLMKNDTATNSTIIEASQQQQEESPNAPTTVAVMTDATGQVVENLVYEQAPPADGGKGEAVIEIPLQNPEVRITNNFFWSRI